MNEGQGLRVDKEASQRHDEEVGHKRQKGVLQYFKENPDKCGSTKYRAWELFVPP